MPLYRARVTTEAAHDTIQAAGDRLDISVRAAAERNQANTAVLRLVKKFLKAKRVVLVSGHHRPSKVVRVTFT